MADLTPEEQQKLRDRLKQRGLTPTDEELGFKAPQGTPIQRAASRRNQNGGRFLLPM